MRSFYIQDFFSIYAVFVPVILFILSNGIEETKVPIIVVNRDLLPPPLTSLSVNERQAIAITTIVAFITAALTAVGASAVALVAGAVAGKSKNLSQFYIFSDISYLFSVTYIFSNFYKMLYSCPCYNSRRISPYYCADTSSHCCLASHRSMWEITIKYEDSKQQWSSIISYYSFSYSL